MQNKPTSGPRFEGELPRGKHPLQLYSMFTPNGNKITILLEELGVAYDAWSINILKGEQFSSGFVKISPNEKIPVLLDTEAGPDGTDLNLFESGAIMVYLAEKYPESGFLPKDPVARARVMQWLMWQMGAAPYFGQYGHFSKFAKEKIPYAIERYSMESQRLLDVLDKQLGRGKYVAGDAYTIADMAIYPWIVGLRVIYQAEEALQMNKYENVQRWVAELRQRPAIVLGMQINNPSGEYANYSNPGKDSKKTAETSSEMTATTTGKM